MSLLWIPNLLCCLHRRRLHLYVWLSGQVQARHFFFPPNGDRGMVGVSGQVLYYTVLILRACPVSLSCAFTSFHIPPSFPPSHLLSSIRTTLQGPGVGQLQLGLGGGGLHHARPERPPRPRPGHHGAVPRSVQDGQRCTRRARSQSREDAGARCVCVCVLE